MPRCGKGIKIESGEESEDKEEGEDNEGYAYNTLITDLIPVYIFIKKNTHKGTRENKQQKHENTRQPKEEVHAQRPSEEHQKIV